MEEHVFFERGSVKVTNARFIVDGQTFAMVGVTSVKSVLISPSIRGPIIAIVVGLMILIGVDGFGKVIGLAIAAIGAWIIYSQKPTHVVMMCSSSNETQALSSTDQDYVSSVINALNDALIHRG